MKICSNCGIEKTEDLFRKNEKNLCGKQCKECYRKKRRIREKTPEGKKKHFEYVNANRSKTRQAVKKWYQKNKEKLKKVRDSRTKEQKEIDKIKNRILKQKYRKNPIFRLENALRQRIYSAIKGKTKKSESTKALLGCTFEFFKEYIENQFIEEMSWENYGVFGWHIDHIKPLVIFDLSDPEQQKECFHYSNMRPLWAKENLSRQSEFTQYRKIYKNKLNLCKNI